MNATLKKESLIEWPEISFGDFYDFDVENKVARVMYKGILIIIFFPEAIFHSFYEILKFKA